MSGPAAKPLELRALERGPANRDRSHRPLALGQTFRPSVEMPPVPPGLSTGARKIWKRLGPELLRYNLMAVVYSDTFEDLCESIADVKMLRHSLRKRQALMVAQKRDPAEAFEATSPNGMPVQHPRYQILRAERQAMHALLAKFGLTPAAQANVTTAIRDQLRLFDGGQVDGEPTPPADPAAPPSGELPGSFADF